MQSTACLSNGPQLGATGKLPSALELLQALSSGQWEQLNTFAQRRLDRVRVTPARQQHLAGWCGGDLVGDVVVKVLLGDQHPPRGRPLRPQHRSSPEALLNRLRADINSELSNRATQADTRGASLPVCNDTAAAAAPLTPARELARSELQAALFARLRQLTRTHVVLRPLVIRWEEQFLESDRIDEAGGNRHQVHRLRQHARRILQELADEQGEADPRLLLQ